MSPQETYTKWRSTLTRPDDSIFYYHPTLDRIILSCAMYQIAARPLLGKLGKAESLTVINIYINEVITAWIDEDGDTFDPAFQRLMVLMESFPIISHGMIERYPGKKKVISELQNSFAYWCAIAGDLSDIRADELLDDIATDGSRIVSDKISRLVEHIQPIVARKGMVMDMTLGYSLIEDFYEPRKVSREYSDDENQTKDPWQKPKQNVHPSLIKIRPVMSSLKPISMTSGNNFYLTRLTNSFLEIVTTVGDDIYFSIYVTHAGKDDVIVVASFGNFFNTIYGRNILAEKILPDFPKSAQKQFPTISWFINNPQMGIDDEMIYLNAIGMAGQPKQWYIMRHVKDDYHWEDLCLNGPASDFWNDILNNVIHATSDIIGEVYAKGTKVQQTALSKLFSFNIANGKAL